MPKKLPVSSSGRAVDDIRPVSRARQLQNFIKKQQGRISEIMSFGGYPSNRAEIESLEQTHQRKRQPNPRFALTPCPFGLDDGAVAGIAARAFRELDEVRRRNGKFNPYNGGNDYDWAFQAGATIAELNAVVTDQRTRIEPARVWLKQQIAHALSEVGHSHGYLKKTLNRLEANSIIRRQAGSRRTTTIAWTTPDGTLGSVDGETMRKIVREVKQGH